MAHIARAPTAYTVIRCIGFIAIGLFSGCGMITTTGTVIQRAQRNLASQHYRAAAVDLENLVSRRPNDATLRLDLAQALLHVGRYGEARSAFQKAEELGIPKRQILPGLVEALLDAGNAHGALDRLDKAAPSPAQEDPALRSLRGRALLALGRLDDSRAALTRALDLNPKDTQAHLALAMLLQRRGDPAGAKAELDRAVASMPADSQVHLALGTWYLSEHRNREAHDELTRALDLATAGIRKGSEPPLNEALALASLADVEIQNGDVASAQERVLQLKKLAPNTRAVSLLQARIARAQQRPVEASTGRPSRKVASADSDSKLNDEVVELAERSNAWSGDITDTAQTVQGSPGSALDGTIQALEQAASYIANNRPQDAQQLLESLKVPERFAARREALLLTALSRTGTRADVQNEARRFASAHSMDMPSLLVAAQALSATKDKVGAHELAEKARQVAPDSPAPFVVLGAVEWSAGDRSGADIAFRHALQIDSHNVGALMGESRIAIAQGNRAAAAQELEQVRGLSSSALAPRVTLVALYLSRGELDKAIAPLSEALKIAPDNPQVQILQATTALELHKTADSVRDFEKLVDKYPKAVLLRTDLARAYALAHRLPDARTAAAEAVKLNPSYWPALALETNLALDAGDTATAVQLLPLLRASKAPPALIKTVAGNVAMSTGHTSEALKDYRAANKLAPSEVLASKIARAQHILHTPDPDGPLRDWLKHAPHDLTARLTLSQYLLQEGDLPSSAREYEAILADNPQQVVALNNLAWIKLKTGENDAALGLSRRAYAIASTNPTVAGTFGWALVETGDAAHGAPVLAAAARAAPGDLGIRYHYGIALVKTGDRTSARRELQAVVDTHQARPEVQQAESLLAGWQKASVPVSPAQ